MATERMSTALEKKLEREAQEAQDAFNGEMLTGWDVDTAELEDIAQRHPEHRPKAKAAGWRLLVKPDLVEHQIGGIILLQQTVKAEQWATTTGVVMDIGPDCWSGARDVQGPWAQVGDRITYVKQGGARHVEDKIEYLFINDEDVLGVIPSEDGHE